MEKEEEREEEEEEVESRCCAKRDFVSLITRNIFPPLPLLSFSSFFDCTVKRNLKSEGLKMRNIKSFLLKVPFLALYCKRINESRDLLFLFLCGSPFSRYTTTLRWRKV